MFSASRFGPREDALLAVFPDSDRGAASRASRKRAGRQRGFEVVSENRLKARHAEYPVLAKFELGDEDEDGSPLGSEAAFDPAWLAWNAGGYYSEVFAAAWQARR